MGCITRIGNFARRISLWICSRQPAFEASTIWAPGRHDIFELSPGQPIRHLGFVQVVHAGRSATHGRLGQFAELQPRNRAQQPPRGRRNRLGVGQVAGVVIGGDRVNAAPRGESGPGRRETR